MTFLCAYTRDTDRRYKVGHVFADLSDRLHDERREPQLPERPRHSKFVCDNPLQLSACGKRAHQPCDDESSAISHVFITQAILVSASTTATSGERLLLGRF